jgi:hypothetical protein
MPHYNIQHMRASGSFATVFDFFATRHSSRLWILFANCESVSVVIAPRGRGKEKMEGDLSVVLRTYSLVRMSIGTGSAQGVGI